MVFSSVIFIFVYLPLFLALYYAFPVRYRSYFILIGSYCFYAWWRVDFALLMLATTAFNYCAALLVDGAQTQRRRKVLLVAAVLADLCLLFYFKYFNFFAESSAFLFNKGEAYSWSLPHVLLPIGISFYIFHNISYVVDVYRRDLEPSRTFVDYAAFIAFFPHQIAGPVLRFSDLAEQFYDREHNWSKFNYGAMRFLTGLAKKVLIADSIAPVADAAFAIPDPTMAESWLGAIAYTLQLYFDFSGYSSMAIGLGMMVGFNFIENFDTPYRSVNITEFWRRWHISLSSWLRDYLYISLGGNRKGIARTYSNLAATMILGGLWHGANTTFLIWGAWHGIWLAIERYLKVPNNAPFRISSWIFTMLLVVIGWVFFRAANMTEATSMLAGMIGLNGISLRSDYAWEFSNFSLALMVVGLLTALSERSLRQMFGLRTTRELAKSAAIDHPPATAVMGVTATLLGLLAILKLVADSDAPFLYFQF
ncbi:MBOAT family protein [Rhizobium sp. MC63]|uniref:MBOAT family protein n=1 Tax=Rhizobium mulingense TaxID=3031128 RepID=A0ACC6N632_9HYPH|nr:MULTISPECIES: MBOAT family protein [unclassified Rhizobium]MDF0700402.1 MBOAT family protein [Rhizobium sp. MC63]MEA3521113.1 MBOAT family protein [Rhizobium sp. MJ31]